MTSGCPAPACPQLALPDTLAACLTQAVPCSPLGPLWVLRAQTASSATASGPRQGAMGGGGTGAGLGLVCSPHPLGNLLEVSSEESQEVTVGLAGAAQGCEMRWGPTQDI